LNLFPQGATGSMQSDGRIVFGDIVEDCEFTQRPLFDVHKFKSGLVFRLQGSDDREYALANLFPNLVRGLHFFSKFCGPLFQFSVIRGASPIVIDDGIP
jgi:hypothetical protein